MDHDPHDAAAAVRRRRKVGRSMREQTPDPKFASNGRRRFSEEDDESSQLDGRTTASEETAQTIRMQIRPPGTMSAHESKILRRRDKTFASAAARSHSQPREAERLSNPEVFELMHTAKRSLSSPRQPKDESSGSELTATGRQLSPQKRAAAEPILPATSDAAATADENLSRLDKNLRRFEDERKRFETEKRNFEREKREHKLRHKQAHDNEERKRLLLQSYRKLSDRISLPTDAEERRRMVHSLRLQRADAPVVRVRTRHSGYDESSTQFSSSDADTAEEATAKRLAKQLSPVRRHASAVAGTHVASVRGPPPLPPTIPERRTVSRNNSLSPIRPQRRSKTPEQRAEMLQKLDRNDEVAKGVEKPSIAVETLKLPERRAEATSTEIDSEREALRRRRSLRQEETFKKQAELRRKQSLERSVPKEVKELKDVMDEKSKEPTSNSSLDLLKPTSKPSLIQRLVRYIQSRRAAKSKPKMIEPEEPLLPPNPNNDIPNKLVSIRFMRLFWTQARYEWRRLKCDYPQEVFEIRHWRNKCVSHMIMLSMVIGFGGLMFRYTEGTAENIYKCEVRKVKRDFIDNLWTVSHNMREDDWKSLARQKLRKFEEELHEIQELGVRRRPGEKSWSFMNCIMFCWTVISTIGYGNLAPKTTLGQACAIIYAIIGIPMFLIVLADFGKLFTRAVKFCWAFVRRVYYTGTCRRIRKQQQIRDAMSGFNTVYDMTMRRPSHFFGMGAETPDIESHASDAERSMAAGSHPETPTSPYPETFEINDEFNLPISLASILLISYILFGSAMYCYFEKWAFFESFYFVFISMSTIGFGDLVPNSPIFRIISIVYLMFGLALTSMFINVVQIKLSDTFKDASAKIGATIGMGLASEMGDGEGDINLNEDGSQIKTPVSDLASVHGSRLNRIGEDGSERSANTLSPQLQSILRPARPVSPAVIGGDSIELATAPPLMPRRPPVVVESPPPPEPEKKKKRRFFK